jgi:hypothetical protein
VRPRRNSLSSLRPLWQLSPFVAKHSLAMRNHFNRMRREAWRRTYFEKKRFLLPI